MRVNASYRTTSLIVILIGIIVTSATAQQMPQFSQFMYNNLVINPAYAGGDGALSLTVLHRSQWTGVDNAPSTQSFSAHTLVKKKQIGLGLTVMRDRIGVHKNTNILSNYAYHIYLKEHSILSMGLQVGITNLKSDYASLAGTPLDPKLVNSINETMLDFGAGIYFRSPRVHLGLSSPGLLGRTVSINDTLSVNFQKANLLGYFRYTFTLNDAFEMQPAVMLKLFKDLPASFDVNLNFIYKKVLTAGVSYRSKESIDMILKFQLTRQLQFGYAYDHPVDYAARLSNASHELMLNYVFKNFENQVASPR